MKQWIVVAVALQLLLGSEAVLAKTYKVDKEHTNVGFAVKHLMISKVRGRFNDFEGEFSFDEKSKTFTTVKATFDVNSIDTNEKDRDKHLKSPDFFGVDPKNPKAPGNKILFEMLTYSPLKGGSGKATGNLTIKGITKKIELEVEEGGFAKDPWGNERAAFTARGKINRKDFGLNWNKVIETGGIMVGEEIELLIEAQGIAI